MPKAKSDLRSFVEHATAVFLKAGGEIKVIPAKVTLRDRIHPYVKDPLLAN